MPYTCTEFRTVLGCDCTGCCQSELDARCVDRVWPARLPALYEFSDGVLGWNIADGGKDLFDTGNAVRVRVAGHWSDPLLYNQLCDGAGAAPVRIGDARYITCKLDSSWVPGYGAAFVTIVASERSLIDGFMVSGNVGADGKVRSGACLAFAFVTHLLKLPGWSPCACRSRGVGIYGSCEVLLWGWGGVGWEVVPGEKRRACPPTSLPPNVIDAACDCATACS